MVTGQNYDEYAPQCHYATRGKITTVEAVLPFNTIHHARMAETLRALLIPHTS